MARHSNDDPSEEQEEIGEKMRNERRRELKRRNRSSNEEESSGSDGQRDLHRKRDSRSRSKTRRRRKKRRSSSESEDVDDDYSYSSSSDSETEVSEEEMRRRRRKRRERRRREKEEERDRRRRRKEKRKKKEKEEKKKKKKMKDTGKTGAVTNSWGKYGVIRETDMWNKRPEFNAWLSEVKKVNLESLANWEEKQMFKEFMEDHNTATFPSKKYYNLDAYHDQKLVKQMKKGLKKLPPTERTVFNDEEQRRQEQLIERERQKEEQVEALKLSMQSGMAQAMKEQAQLKEEMAYQYKIGNFEAAAAIQKRLNPDIAM